MKLLKKSTFTQEERGTQLQSSQSDLKNRVHPYTLPVNGQHDPTDLEDVPILNSKISL